MKSRLLGHWGTTPVLNFIYVHLNRIIRERDLSVIYVCGPGNGGPGMVANTCLEGTYTELYPSVGQDVEGLRRLFRQFSFPGGIPSHAALETLAAVDLLRQSFPELLVRVVNVVDLMRLQPREEHAEGLTDRDFDTIFTTDRPIIFAYHGYPYLVHRLTYRRTNHANLHVRGYKEEGTTTTPFDMVVLNDLDRYHLAMDAIARVPKLGPRAAHAKQEFRDRLIEHQAYIGRWGDDPPEIRDWKWPHG